MYLLRQVYISEDSKGMALGEYEGSKALYDALPDNIPKLIISDGCSCERSYETLLPGQVPKYDR